MRMRRKRRPGSDIWMGFPRNLGLQLEVRMFNRKTIRGNGWIRKVREGG
jgi:hypothetical protein